MKAIHNAIAFNLHLDIVVINHKTTKFESNSQQLMAGSEVIDGCYQSQNYKI
ncbi:hypothetical protein [Capnocytophaga sputigena]|uniref:hypothetical protein n=1 Tax=Capnocytophaga sputigena TaxID=1019 RepID=UPI0028D50C5C|nr:hypothetical protein [Capnocytophaga sputigena]